MTNLEEQQAALAGALELMRQRDPKAVEWAEDVMEAVFQEEE